MGDVDWHVRVDVERALRLVRLKKKSNFRTLPELLRVLTHLIENAGSGRWFTAHAAQK